MFLRRYERRKDGKVHTYWALVESYRTGQGSRQRIVAYLGELQAGEEAGWAKLGRNLDGKAPPSPTRTRSRSICVAESASCSRRVRNYSYTM